MHWEKADKLIHTLVHPTIKVGEGCQVVPDPALLFSSLAQQTFRHHELNIFAGNKNLLEAIFDPAQVVGDKGKSGAIKNGLLYSGHEAKTQILANLTHLPQKAKIQDEFLVFAGSQVVKQFIHHHQETMIRKLVVKGQHHLLKRSFVICNCGDIREREVDTNLLQVFFQLSNQDIPQGHGGCSDFCSHYLEPTRNCFRCFRNLRIGNGRVNVGVLGQAGDYRHEVGFTGTIVAYYQ